jgi:hypothetical protein
MSNCDLASVACSKINFSGCTFGLRDDIGDGAAQLGRGGVEGGSVTENHVNTRFNKLVEHCDMRGCSFNGVKLGGQWVKVCQVYCHFTWRAFHVIRHTSRIRSTYTACDVTPPLLKPPRSAIATWNTPSSTIVLLAPFLSLRQASFAVSGVSPSSPVRWVLYWIEVVSRVAGVTFSCLDMCDVYMVSTALSSVKFLDGVNLLRLRLQGLGALNPCDAYTISSHVYSATRHTPFRRVHGASCCNARPIDASARDYIAVPLKV